MSYVSLEELKAYIRNEMPSADDVDLQQALDSADLWINHRCARVFAVADVAPSARTYVPSERSPGVLRIHDATTVTSVVENGVTLVVGDDYQLEPVNTLSWAGETLPYEQIRRQLAYWYDYYATGTVVVTGTWGWPAVPTPVKMAEKIVAKDIMLHRDVKFGLVGVTEFGGVRARTATLAGELLEPYRRLESYPSMC